MKSFKYNNNEVGAKVLIPKLLKSITPERGWQYLKKVTGVIVPRGEHEHYYHSSNGGGTYPRKHLIQNDCHPHYAIKLDNDQTDIEGNNIVIIREYDLKFLETKEVKNPIARKEYNKALKIIQEFENYSDLKRIGKW